ncbi:MAG: hypothetical protein GX613_09425 [Chloroflexi bacterium]|nr:hypothetical protein [Chloroflexota bacterium]
MFHPVMRRHTTIVPAALLLAITLIAAVALLVPSARAQQPPTSTPAPTFPITFSGPVESVGPRFIVVNGLLVDLVQATVPQNGMQLGAVVTVSGNLIDSMIVASRVELGDTTGNVVQPPPATPANITTPTPPPLDLRGSVRGDDGRARRIVVQGPVREITPTSLRIFNLEVDYDPTIVNVTNIQVGDNVRVEGDFVIVNNTYNIVAMNVTVVNTPVFRGGSVDSRPSDSIDTRQSDRASDRDSVQPAQPPPPPPPAPAPSRGSDSAASGRGSVSAASGRDS